AANVVTVPAIPTSAPFGDGAAASASSTAAATRFCSSSVGGSAAINRSVSRTDPIGSDTTSSTSFAPTRSSVEPPPISTTVPTPDTQHPTRPPQLGERLRHRAPRQARLALAVDHLELRRKPPQNRVRLLHERILVHRLPHRLRRHRLHAIARVPLDGVAIL